MHLFLFFSLSNLIFLRVIGGILFVGNSKVMVSLTPDRITMQFRVFRIFGFLGRVFGNLRFLSEWLSSCGQLLTIGFSHWIISCFRGRTLASRCCMCCCDGESVDHLLLHCPVTHTLWTFMLKAYGIHWVMPGLVAGLLSCWY